MILRRVRFAPENILGFIIFLSVVGFLFNTVSPDAFFAAPGMLISIMFCLYFLSITLTGHVRRSVIIALATGMWIGLRMIGLKSALYPILILLLFSSIEYGASKNNGPQVH